MRVDILSLSLFFFLFLLSREGGFVGMDGDGDELCQKRDRGVRSKEQRLGSWDLCRTFYGREEQLLGFFTRALSVMVFEHSLCLEHGHCMLSTDGVGQWTKGMCID